MREIFKQLPFSVQFLEPLGLIVAQARPKNVLVGAGDYADRVDLQVVDLADGSQNIGFAGFATGRGEQAKAGQHHLLNLLLTEIDFVIHEGYFILIRMPECLFRSGSKKSRVEKTNPAYTID